MVRIRRGLFSLVFGALLAAFTLAADPARAQVGFSVSIGLPPPIVFAAPPMLVAFPGSYIYAVPDYGEDLFFVDGWWWRPWSGRWYRSRYYDRDWSYYSSVPYFYRSVPRDWRVHYHDHRWGDRPWTYDRVSYNDVQRNWSSWKQKKHWDRVHEERVRRGDVRRGDGRDGDVRTLDRTRDTRSYDRSPARQKSDTIERRAPAQKRVERSPRPADRAPSRAVRSAPSKAPKTSPQVRGSKGPSPKSSPARSGGSSKKASSGGGKGSGSKGHGGGR